MGSQHQAPVTGCETLLAFEFAFSDVVFPFAGPGIGAAGQFAIEPVLYSAVLNHHATGVPFADWFEELILRRVENVVDAGGVMIASLEGVGMFKIVDHLVLDAEPFFANLGDPILNPIVPAFREFPVPGEFKIGIFLLAEQEASLAGEMQHAVVDRPALWLGAVGTGPVGQGFAVEERSPDALGTGR